MDWVTPLGIAAGFAAGPWLAKVWAKIEAYDERRIAEWEAEQALKRQLKLDAKTRYTSATVDRLFLGHDREEQ